MNSQLGQVRYIELRRCINVPVMCHGTVPRPIHELILHPTSTLAPAGTDPGMLNVQHLSIILFFLTCPKLKPSLLILVARFSPPLYTHPLI